METLTKTEYYLPGSNANLLTIRREDNYDRNYHGCGDIMDVEITACDVFNLAKDNQAIIKQRDELLEALKFARQRLLIVGDANYHHIDDAIAKATGVV